MRLFVAYFSQMGRSGCGEDPTFLLAALQKHISSWEGVASVETKCFQAPGKWAPYLTDSDDETRVGDDIYATLGGTAWDAWHELQGHYDAGDCLFLFLGGSNGCIPAAFFAKQFSDKVLSLTFLSCVPGKEQWGDVSRLQCPVTVTCGSKEQFFGGSSAIYSFAQQTHASVFSFWGQHLFEGKDVLRRLASFVADASKPSAPAPASPRRSPSRRKSESPSSAKKSDTKATGRSPSRRRRFDQLGGSKMRQRRNGAGKKKSTPRNAGTGSTWSRQVAGQTRHSSSALQGVASPGMCPMLRNLHILNSYAVHVHRHAGTLAAAHLPGDQRALQPIAEMPQVHRFARECQACWRSTPRSRRRKLSGWGSGCSSPAPSGNLQAW